MRGGCSGSSWSCPILCTSCSVSLNRCCGHEGKGLRGEVAQGTVGTFAVVVPPPSIYFLPSVLQRQEPTFVEAFSPKPGIEGLDHSVVCRLAWPAGANSVESEETTVTSNNPLGATVYCTPAYTEWIGEASVGSGSVSASLRWLVLLEASRHRPLYDST